MSNTKHDPDLFFSDGTPRHSTAPWSVGAEFGLHINIDSDGDEQYAIAQVSHGDPNINRNNAALIAAAPDLLYALQYLVRAIESCPLDLTGYVGLGTSIYAIAKAEGRKQ